MPRADHLATFDYTLAEWASAVQADIIHGADFAVHVGDADGLVATGGFFGLIVGGQVGF